MPHAILHCLYSPDSSLEVAVDILAERAIELVREGASLLILTDRGADARAIPVPMAMAAGAVHLALTQAGVRAEVGLAVEAGRLPRDSSRRGAARHGRRRGLSVART